MLRMAKIIVYVLFIAVVLPGYAVITNSDEENIVLINKANALIYLQFGIIYDEGLGVSENYQAARHWFEKSAEQNNADALFYLGEFYMDGTGVLQDVKKGKQLYQKAAKLGSSHAMNNLGLLAKQAGRTEEAISLYQQAISAGSDVSLLNLGRLYQEIGEYTKSEEILTIALGKNRAIRAEALNKLGTLYTRINFKGYDIKKAEGYYLESVKLGSDVSLNNLGMLYFHNDEYNKAFDYIKMAADKNLPDAINNLGALYQHGYGVKQDYAKAILLYAKSARMGSPGAYFNLGGMYEHGEGVTQDDTKALEYYEQALAAGHYPAQKKIDLLKAKQRK